METGVEVWVRDKMQAWIPAVVTSKEIKADGMGYALVVTRGGFDEEDMRFEVPAGDDELEDVKLRNDKCDLAVENLINLPHLHEPAILYCLEQRYNKSDIYTYTGPILIAVNPFKRIPLYTTEILESYYSLGLLKSQGMESPAMLGPHVYAVGDASYRNMMTVIHAGHQGSHKDYSADQVILISGESGSGKTESTKIVLRYLTTVGNSSGGHEIADGSVMSKVLHSNPILESFGNAKTIRNDNSSRFGKFIELNFNKRGHLIGGTIRTYLLEKVRLPAQQLGERNFHIFYQMLAGASPEQLQLWHLQSAQDYFYTSQGHVFELRDMNDKEEYNEMRLALNTLNFDEGDQTSLFRAMAGVLHIGQIQFSPDKDGEGCEFLKNATIRKSAEYASELLGISFDVLVRALTTRVITTRDESMTKSLTVKEAIAARDALSKAIYGRLFNWIVQTINKSIQVEASMVRADIGVLDIFGFECFKSNSFEQLCINYTNETLQQQFNQFVFKMEQLEYKKEKIEWSFISFPDNQDCLDLIEHKLTGILAMVDDECRLPKATDERLAARMYKSLESHSRFTATAPQKRDSMFCIKHYAGPVVYCTTTFVDKNKDELPKEAITLMSSSSLSLLSDIFVLDPIPDYTLAMQQQHQLQIDKSNNDKKLSVSAQFKSQLGTLMEKIYATKPHYIRCLKPNDQNVSDNFNRLRTTEQLRYGGVLEAVRVARSGFPVRLSHSDFYARYRPLANPFIPATMKLPRIIVEGMDAKSFCETLLGILWDHATGLSPSYFPYGRNPRKIADLKGWLAKITISAESIQLGLTKAFLRKQAHDLLEARRSRRLAGAARMVQNVMRCQRDRRVFMLQLWALKFIQRIARGMIGRKCAMLKRQTRSAIAIQSCYRMQTAQFKYKCFHFAIVSLQSLFRCRKAWRAFRAHMYKLRGAKLCKIMRVLFARRQINKSRRAIVALQCRLRIRKARAVLKKLRLEAKDVGSLKQSNQNLKAEIEMLRSRARIDAEEKAKEAATKAEQRAFEQASMQQKAQFELIVQELELTKAALVNEKMRRSDAEASLLLKDLDLAELHKILEVEKFAHASILAMQSKSHSREMAKGSFSSNGSDSNSSSPRESIVLVSPRDNSFAVDNASFKVSPRPAIVAAAPALASGESLTAFNLPGNECKSEEKDAAASPYDFDNSGDYADGEEILALKSMLRDERVAKLLLEEEAARLRRISMDLTAQMDTLRRNQIAVSSTGSASTVGTGVTRRPDENPRRRRYMVSAANSVTAKSKTDIDSTKKVAVGLRLNEVSEGLPEMDHETRVFVTDSTECVNAEQEHAKVNMEVDAATLKFHKNLTSFRQKFQQVSSNPGVFLVPFSCALFSFL